MVPALHFVRLAKCISIPAGTLVSLPLEPPHPVNDNSRASVRDDKLATVLGCTNVQDALEAELDALRCVYVNLLRLKVGGADRRVLHRKKSPHLRRHEQESQSRVRTACSAQQLWGWHDERPVFPQGREYACHA
jgi:hypothetical protein